MQAAHRRGEGEEGRRRRPLRTQQLVVMPGQQGQRQWRLTQPVGAHPHPTPPPPAPCAAPSPAPGVPLTQMGRNVASHSVCLLRSARVSMPDGRGSCCWVPHCCEEGGGHGWLRKTGPGGGRHTWRLGGKPQARPSRLGFQRALASRAHSPDLRPTHTAGAFATCPGERPARPSPHCRLAGADPTLSQPSPPARPSLPAHCPGTAARPPHRALKPAVHAPAPPRSQENDAGAPERRRQARAAQQPPPLPTPPGAQLPSTRS